MKMIESPVGAEIVLEGRRYINFGGSSYLGLSAKKEIVEAGLAALRFHGSGYQFPKQFEIATQPHREAEAQIATFFDTQAGFYLAAGYYFGLVALAALRERFTAIFYDEWAHYSLREAIAASGLSSYAFRHCDPQNLEEKLERHLRPGDKPLIVTDGMYSTFGEIAPLHDYAKIMTPYEGRLLVDESHGFGVLGETGRGAGEHHSVPHSSILIGGSIGKALGVLGGIIPASAEEVAAFRETSVGRGAAAGMPAAAAMCAASLKYIRDHPELLRRLRDNVVYMKRGLHDLGLKVADSVTPVASFTTGSDRATRDLRERLLDEGIHVFYSTYIGAETAGVIRCGIFADHTREHMDRLFAVLRRLL